MALDQDPWFMGIKADVGGSDQKKKKIPPHPQHRLCPAAVAFYRDELYGWYHDCGF